MALALVCSGATAAESLIKLKSAAPEGTELRIQTSPYGSATVSGATPGTYFGTYLAPAPGTEIVIAGEVDQLEVYSTSSCRNQFTELEVVAAPDLYILRCYDNELTSLSVEKCPKLAVLECGDNKLTSLDLTKNTLLETVKAENNLLEDVQIGVNATITDLRLGNNQLPNVDVSGCAALEELYVNNNKLTSLDLSQNPKLWWLYVFGNQMAGAGMNSFVTNLNKGAQTPSMLYVVDTRNENEGNVCTMANVAELRDKSWVSCDWTGGAENPGMTGTFYYGSDYQPELSERTITMSTSRAAGEKVTFNIKATEDISITGIAETSSFTGKNTFTLTGSEIVVTGDVTLFECPDNDLTSLVIAGPDPLFTQLDCSGNKLASLVVTNAAAMTQLHCQNNKLEQLNVEGCNNLLRVNCYRNALKGLPMKRFMQSLCQSTAEPYLFVIDTKAPEGTEQNVCTTNDVAIAKGRGWKVFDWVDGDRYGMGLAYEGSEPTEPEMPEEYFTLTSSAGLQLMFNVTYADENYTPVVEGGELIGWNGTALTIKLENAGDKVTVYGDALTLLALYAELDDIDVTHLPSLHTLNVGLNNLKSLDLSGCTKLESLSCEGNGLTTLDLSASAALDYVNCTDNKIEGENMVQMIASLPERTLAHTGTMIVYDPAYDGETGNKCNKADVAAAKAKYWGVYMINENDELDAYPGYDYNAIGEISEDAAMAEYYGLDGTRLNVLPRHGVVIVRRGAEVKKVIM